jgi:hypothetical protein
LFHLFSPANLEHAHLARPYSSAYLGSKSSVDLIPIVVE